MRYLRYAALAVMTLCALGAAAQSSGYLTLSGTHLVDSTGTPISNATISFAPVSNAGVPIGYQVGGGGQVIMSPVTAQVTSGAFSVQIADTSLTNPKNVCFKVIARSNVTGQVLLSTGYSCVQPGSSGHSSWCSTTICNFDNFVPALAPLVEQSVGTIGPQGPPGATGATGAPGGSLSYPGVTSDNANGLSITGKATATILAGSEQRLSGLYLTHMRAVEASMFLHEDQPTIYPNAVQGVIYLTGDSTGGGTGASTFICQLQQSDGQAGNTIVNTTAIQNMCPAAALGYSLTYSGGAYQIDGVTHAYDFDHCVINGECYVLPPGGAMTNYTTGYSGVKANRFLAWLNSDTGATYEVDYSTDGSTWTALANGTTPNGGTSTCSGTAAANTGTVCDNTTTLTAGTAYYFRVINTGTSGNIYVNQFYPLDTNRTGWIVVQLERGGLGMGDAGYTGSAHAAVITPYVQDLPPDLITEQWKFDAPSNTSCQVSPTNETDYQSWTYWHNQIFDILYAAQPTAGITPSEIFFGSYNLDGTLDENGCIKSTNEDEKALAVANNSLYVDNYAAYTYTQALADGLLAAANVHTNSKGNLTYQAVDFDRNPELVLSLGGLGASVAPVATNNLATNNLFITPISTRASFYAGDCAANPCDVANGNAFSISSNSTSDQAIMKGAQIDLYDPTGTNLLAQFNTQNNGSPSSAAALSVSIGYPLGWTTTSSVLANFNGTNANGATANFELSGSAYASIFGSSSQSQYFWGLAGTRYWSAGMYTGINATGWQLRDSVSGHYVIEFPGDTMPQGSLGGNANGATGITQASCDTSTNLATDQYVGMCAPVVTTPTPSGTCTANGYITATINGTTVHLATCE